MTVLLVCVAASISIGLLVGLFLYRPYEPPKMDLEDREKISRSRGELPYDYSGKGK